LDTSGEITLTGKEIEASSSYRKTLSWWSRNKTKPDKTGGYGMELTNVFAMRTVMAKGLHQIPAGTKGIGKKWEEAAADFRLSCVPNSSNVSVQSLKNGVSNLEGLARSYYTAAKSWTGASSVVLSDTELTDFEMNTCRE
jgi:hypothetical protein